MNNSILLIFATIFIVKISSATLNCPSYTFSNDRCTSKGGHLSIFFYNGCSKPSCVFEDGCWSEKLGYPCCSYLYDTEVVYTDEDGEWGIENGKWCGIHKSVTTKDCPKAFSFTSRECTQRGGYVGTQTISGCPYPTCVGERSCPTFTFPYDRCTNKGGNPSTVVRSGCPTPTCVFDDCWSEKLGYPCCNYLYNTKIEYIDKDGEWGIENGNWCGIYKKTTITKTCPTAFTFTSRECTSRGGYVGTQTIDGCPYPTCVNDIPITTSTPSPTPTTRKTCPLAFTFTYNECSERGGHVETKTIDGCPYPTCVGERPCPTYSYPTSSCTSKGGYISTVTRTGCPSPTCVIDIPITTSTPSPTPTTRKTCPLAFTFTYNECSERGGHVETKTIDGCPYPTCVGERRCPTYSYPTSSCTSKGGYVSTVTRTGCPSPTCVIDIPITTSTPSPTPTTRKTCPLAFTFTYNECSKRGGHVETKTIDGCPYPTCVGDSSYTGTKTCPTAFTFTSRECTSKGGYVGTQTIDGCPYPTCVNDIPITTSTPSPTPTTRKTCPLAFTFTYNECSEKGGHVETKTIDGCPYPTCVGERPCPTYSYPTSSCTSKGGYVSTVTRTGCPSPTCVTECWAEKFGYPCCVDNTNVRYQDNDGLWGIENGHWCGIRF